MIRLLGKFPSFYGKLCRLVASFPKILFGVSRRSINSKEPNHFINPSKLVSSSSSAAASRNQIQMERTPLLLVLLHLLLLLGLVGLGSCSDYKSRLRRRQPSPENGGVCTRLLRPLGYPCEEHTVRTKDGYLLAVQHIPHGRNALKVKSGRRPPVFLQHGLFQGGDTWFMNSIKESLGYILADHGFDVWVGSVRGTRWSYGHVTLSPDDRDFWDWSWQDLAQYDLVDMISYVYSFTSSKVLFVGHSQGTIMALAAFTMPDVVDMIEAAALLCPISYLDHLSSKLILRAVSLHLDQLLLTLGIHQLNFRSDIGIEILDTLCDGHLDCSNILASITGDNCCFNGSRVDYYLDYEPHPSSTKNLKHLFQMIRKGTFARFDYGWWGNLKAYGHFKPPVFDLANIPDSLPLWMGFGGNDALADMIDVKRTIKELRSEPVLLYNETYGHIDFIMSVNAKDDIYGNLITFFRSCGLSTSY